MMDEIHIPDGIAVKLLLAGLVLAGGAVGALGVTPVASQAVSDGLADDPSPALMFPINNVTAGVGSLQLSLDGKGNDPFPSAFSTDDVASAFPINNVTATGGPWDTTGNDRIGSAVLATIALGQDMDPY